jgi:hypothetical protein
VIVFLPVVWVIGLSHPMNQVQGLTSGLVGHQLAVTDHLGHAGRPALGRLLADGRECVAV